MHRGRRGAWRRRMRAVLAGALFVFSTVTSTAMPAAAQGAGKPAPSGGDPAAISRYPAVRTTLQASVDPAVTQAFQKNDQVTYLVKLRARADVEGAAAQAARSASPATKTVAARAAVIKALREVAATSQAGLLAELEKARASGAVTSYEPFWIANIVAVTSTEEVMKRIANRADVEAILPNGTIHLVGGTAPLAPSEASKEAPGSVEQPRGRSPPAASDRARTSDANVEWNIQRIGAPAVWSTYEIDGTGAVVGSMDTGVDWTHPALHDNWRGYDPTTGTVDPTYSWFDAVNGESMPYDDHGHGTHTTGTAVGRAVNGQNVIGVAPGARWIAAKILDANGFGTDVDILEAGQWMMAPGGDPSKAPDVINNSWGGGPGLDEWFRDVVTAWRAAGIFPAFANGNDGPDPGTAGEPGNYPESFAVGATDRNDQIASFSSRGPSPYGEIKPEISAPGVNVRSSVPGGGYEGGWSGTSMATPHVTGTVALLRSANANLTVDQIEQILESTADPRTDAQYPDVPNNGYGWGIVNAFNAVGAVVAGGIGQVTGHVLTSGDDVTPPAVGHDPITESYKGLPIDITATVSDDVSVTGVQLYFHAPGFDWWGVVDMTRTSGDYRSGTYEAQIPASMTLGDSVEYFIEAVDYGDNRGYSGTSDDPHVVSLRNGVQPGYLEDFEDGAPGWMHGGQNDPWQIGVPTSGPGAAHSGQNVAATNLSGNYPNNADAFLLMPPIDLSQGPAALRFWQWYRLETNYDFGYVLASGDGGQTWDTLMTINGTGTTWSQAVVDLARYAGNPAVLVAFYIYSDGSVTFPGWYIDDVELYSDSEAPSAPTGLTAQPSMAGGIALSWDAVDAPDLDHYTVYREVGGSYQALAEVNGTQYLDSDVTPGETYTYVVTATDIFGNESGYSNAASATAPGVQTIFFDNMESGPGQWTHAGANDPWEWGAPTSGPGRAFSGSNVWATNLSGNYPNNVDASLVSPVIDLAGYSSATLQFAHWYSLERNYDSGYVEVKPVGANQWTMLAQYTAPASGGQPVGWEQPIFDLSAYAGQAIQIRFRMHSDGSVNYAGWYIDDVRVAGTPQSMPGAPEPANPTQLSIATTDLPAGTVGMPYSQQLQATGGTGPYTWSVAGGSLPDGLRLDTVTGQVYGTPTTAGTATFTVQVTDSSDPQQTATADLSITVQEAGDSNPQQPEPETPGATSTLLKQPSSSFLADEPVGSPKGKPEAPAHPRIDLGGTEAFTRVPASQLAAPGATGGVKGQGGSAASLPLSAAVTVLETGRVVRTDPATGAFSITLPAGNYTLRAESYGYFPQDQTVTVSADAPAQVEFVLQPIPRGDIVGHVTDRRTGEPIAGATVEVEEDPLVPPATTDADGSYTLHVLAGSYTVRARAVGYLPGEATATIAGGDTVTADIALNPFIGMPGEIAYDDGSAENAWAMNDAGNGFAVLMSPGEPGQAVTLRTLRFYLWDDSWPTPGGNTFHAEVFDVNPDGTPGKLLADVPATNAVRGDWTDVDVSSLGLTVSGDFVVAFVQDQPYPNTPGLATDESSPDSGRNWQLVGGGWSPWDQGGNFMIRAVVDYAVGPPVITSPEDGAYTNQTAINVTGTAHPGTLVTLYADGNPVGTATADNAGGWTIPVTLEEGVHMLTATATVEGEGPGTGTTDPSAPVVVTVDTTAPTLDVAAPADGSVQNTRVITVQGSLADANPGSVLVGDTKAALSEDGAFQAEVIGQEGANTITLTATDLAGNETTVARTVYIDTVAPVITNVQPDTDHTLRAGDHLAVSFDSEPGLALAAFQVVAGTPAPGASGGKASGSALLPGEMAMHETSPGHYEAVWTVPQGFAAPRAYVRVRAVDAAGNEAVATAPGTVTVQAPAPPSSGGGGGGGGGGGVTPPGPQTPSGSATIRADQRTTVTSADSGLTVVVPAGAAPDGSTITVSQLSPKDQPAPGAGMVMIDGQTYEIDVKDASGGAIHAFDRPLHLSFAVDGSSLPEGAELSDLQILYWDTDLKVWVPVPTTVDPVAGTVSADVTHLTVFTVAVASGASARVPHDVVGHWAESDVLKLVALGVVSGYGDGTFHPDGPVTRAEFAKMLVLALGLEPKAGATTFADVPSDAWYAPYVNAAAEAGIVNGVAAKTFAPNALVNREQMAAMLARALKLTGGAQLSFADAATIDAWALPSVGAAVEAGYIMGFPDGTFRPFDQATRAQAAKVLLEVVLHSAR
ncbi:MAG: S8 family serine peptidase [Clostridia bacterium]|nr:S8 family serine peptidase [Clostridia bacterium]